MTNHHRKKIYISDLDGTLLRNDATMSKQSITILNKLLSEGLLFTVASARSVITIREVINGVNLSLPIIELNGAFVSELSSGRHLIINHIAPALLPRLEACIQKYNAVPIIATYDGQRDRLYYNRAHRPFFPWFEIPTFSPI